MTRGYRNRFFLAAFLWRLLALPGGAGAEAIVPIGEAELPDISGIYRTRHPDDRLGCVLIRFARLRGFSGGDSAASREWSVSLWSAEEENPRKIRDGLFGTYTAASVRRREGGLSLVWRSPDGGAELRNDIVSITDSGDIEVGASGEGFPDSGARYRLERVSGPDLPIGIEGSVEIEGVYDYYHAATGRVLVAFAKSPIPAKAEYGARPEAYSVRIVRDLGESRFAVEREGLYGGSRPLDEFSLVSVERSGDDAYLVWRKPGRPKESRRNRIVCLYPSGDIGIGLEEGEAKYVQDTLFRKVAGPEALIGEALDFMSPEGYFELSLWPGSSGSSVSAPGSAIARIARTPAMLGSRRLYSIEPVAIADGIAEPRRDGFPAGVRYGHMTFDSEGGRCRVAFVDLEAGREEVFFAIESRADGSFALGRRGGEPGLRPRPEPVVARFAKIAGLDTNPIARGAPERVAASKPSGAASAAINPSYRIAASDEAAWTEEETSAIASAIARLPPGFIFGKPVSILRSSASFSLGSGKEGGSLIELSIKRRELRIKRIESAEGFPGDIATARAAYLERALVRILALISYDSLAPALKREWEAFNGWNLSFLSPPAPLNQNAEGFADELGRASPAEDFAAFAEDVFLAPSGLDPESFVRFRLPDRYAFFRKLFPDLPAEPAVSGGAGRMPRAESFRDSIDPAEIEGIDLVVTTPTSTSIESIAGHVLLLIKRKGDYEDCGDSIVLGFVGEISRDSANGIRGLTYVYRGLTGYYRSLIQVETFADLVRRATVVENRDVFRLRLRLEPEEAERLVERLWVVDRTFTYRYCFFSGNCVSMLLDALNYAFLDGRKIKARGGIDAPMRAVAELARAGRIEGFSYPERWSVLKSARYATRENRAIARELLGILEKASLREEARAGASADAPGPAAAALENARESFAVLFDRGEGEIALDPLFRIPIIARTGPDRSAAYLRMAMACEELHETLSGPLPVLDAAEYARLVELTARFLLGAFDRELYTAVPADIKKRYGKEDLALMDSPEDIIERRLYKVRSRQENSPELQAVRLAVSSLRRSMEELGFADGLYTLGRAMSEEREGEIASEREKAAFTHGYYERRLAATWAAREDGSEAGLEFETALYRGEMGDVSVCSLKRDMRLVLLRGAIGGYWDFEGGLWPMDASSLSVRTRSVAFDFDKIVVGDDVDYSGFFRFGFGFTLMRSEGILWDGESWFPPEASRTTFLEARGLFNIFEIDDFRHYLTIGAGAGLQRSADEGLACWGAATPVFFEAKAGLRGGELRSLMKWEFRFPEDGPPASRLGISLDGSFALSRRSNAVLGFSAAMGFDFSHEGAVIEPIGRDLGFSFVVKIR